LATIVGYRKTITNNAGSVPVYLLERCSSNYIIGLPAAANEVFFFIKKLTQQLFNLYLLNNYTEFGLIFDRPN